MQLHTISKALAAEAEGANYIGVGVAGSNSKDDAIKRHLALMYTT